MSTLKKIGKIFLVLLIAAVYFNIGYWLGNEYYSAFQSPNRNITQSFFYGPKISPLEGPDMTLGSAIVTFSIFWPIAVGIIALYWMACLILLGELFRAIGTVFSVLLTIAAILAARMIWVKKHQSRKP